MEQSGHIQRARIVIYDPVSQNMRATRYGLHEAGFRDIEGYSEVSELKKRLEDEAFDMLVAEIGERREFLKVVQELRRGDLGENPFAVIFLTSWQSDMETMSAALSSGADDVIVRPFSTAFMKTRVRSAIQNRKKFVVTSDYLGPDRRSDPNRESDESVRAFQPPNTLRSAVMGDTAALDARSGEIETFKMIVRRERVVRLAVRVAVEAELAMAGSSRFSTVQKRVHELHMAAGQADGDASRLTGAMVRQLEDDGDASRRLKMVRELSQGVCALCGGDGEGAEATGRGRRPPRHSSARSKRWSKN